MTDKEFAQRLALLREQKGVSARDMSLSIGQNHNYINNIETERSLPSMSGFFYICEYLGIEPRDFFDLDSTNPSKLDGIIEDMKKLTDKQLDIIAQTVKEFKRKP